MTHTESHPPQIFYHKKKKRWLTTTIFLSVTCYNVTILTTNYYTDFFELGQQKINFNFYELSLPDDDPVYTLKKVMEDLDFSGALVWYREYPTVFKKRYTDDLPDSRKSVISL